MGGGTYLAQTHCMAMATTPPRFTLERLLMWDERMMRRVARARTRKMTRLMRVITPTPVWVSAFILCLARVADADGWHAALAAGFVAGMAALFVQGIKLSVRRTRPMVIESLSKTLDKYSFPSGHSGTAFALAAVALFVCPALFPVAALAAALVAYSRVYLGVHYLSDVITGAVVGLVVGAATTGFGLAGTVATWLAG